MKNKIYLKKCIHQSMFIIFLFLLFFSIIHYIEYRTYTFHVNQKIDSILKRVYEEYPNISKDEWMELINTKTTESSFLKEYGIDIGKDTVLLENKKEFNKFFLLNSGLFFLLSMVLFFLFLLYHHKKNKELKEITNYIEQINRKNYKLDIDKISEDELSILKQEIYKTTIMLKEQSENSKKDKINLKNSLSDISHQLKTPLTSILIILDDLIDDPNMDSATREDFIRDIKREITNIHFLVQSLLKLAKFDANTTLFTKEKVSLKRIVEEATKKVATLCDLKNIEIKTIGEEREEIFCDLKWQVEALTNIIKNAIEHSTSGQEVTVSWQQNQVYSIIFVEDHGIGIDKKDLPHIFKRFYKGKNATSESVGIGLALAKTIIEKDNGTIKVESSPQKTVFQIKYFH